MSGQRSLRLLRSKSETFQFWQTIRKKKRSNAKVKGQGQMSVQRSLRSLRSKCEKFMFSRLLEKAIKVKGRSNFKVTDVKVILYNK